MSRAKGGIQPTGECFCGCGRQVEAGAFFAQGHDKKATMYLDGIFHGGSIAARVVAHGYGPGGRNLRDHTEKLGLIERCGIGDCPESFTVGSRELRQHRATAHRGE